MDKINLNMNLSLSLFLENNWSCKRHFNGPAKLSKPTVERLRTNSDFIRPIYNTHSLAAPSDISRPAGVAHLAVLRNPSTVHRPAITQTFFAFSATVMSIIVDTVYGVSAFRNFSNILKKINECAHPSLAHLNAATPIVLETGGVFVCAPLNNSLPFAVFQKTRHPVRGIPTCRHSGPKTPARFCVSNFHPSRLTGDKPPTIAKAVALGFIGRSALQRHADYDQTSKPLAGYVVNTVESLALKWKAFSRFSHNAYMTEFSERRLMTGAAFAFSLCPKAVVMQ